MSDFESTHCDLDMNSSSELNEAEFYELYLCPHCPEGVFGFRCFEMHIGKKHPHVQFNPIDVEMRLICLSNIETVIVLKKNKSILKERTRNKPKNKIKALSERVSTVPKVVKMEITSENKVKSEDVPLKTKNIPKKNVPKRKNTQKNDSIPKKITRTLPKRVSIVPGVIKMEIASENQFKTEDAPIKSRNMPKKKTEKKTENIPKKNTKNMPNKKTKTTLKSDSIPKKFTRTLPKRRSTRSISKASSSVPHNKTKSRISQASESKPVAREYVCSHCPAKLYGMKAYRDHVKSVHNVKIARSISRASSSVPHNNTKSRISSQASESKPAAREYVCSHCPAKLYGMKNYRDHVKSVHNVKIEIIINDYQPVNDAELFNENVSSYSNEIHIKEEIC